MAVHKVLVEKEYVIQKGKDGNDIKAYSESEMKD